MPGFKLLTKPTNTVYEYDGSLGGFYCCVHESIYKKEMPLEIIAEGNGGLLPPRFIETDREKALKVRESIRLKISAEALEICETVFLTNLAQKETHILKFLLRGYEEGPRVMTLLTDFDVAPMLEAQRFIGNEAHLLKGFVRFREYDGKLVATITPKNYVLPVIAPHFCERFAEETFMIYDKTHRVALVYEKGRMQIGYMPELNLPPMEEKEKYFQALWRQFYETIAIKARRNERCRMGHMPKRYWENMLEMDGERGVEIAARRPQ